MSLFSVVEARTPSQLDDVRGLFRAFVAWQRERYSAEVHLIERYFDSAEYAAEIAGLPGAYAAPRGRLLLARDQAQPAGCVALRDLGDGVCEMKRMFVYPEYRGKAVGRLLGAAIVEAAKQLGYATMRLDTGRRQIEAQTLYHGLGFTDIEPYYPIPDELRGWLVFMELTLLPAKHLDERVDESLQESFPASDVPAVHATDEPPVNSQARWDAASLRRLE